MQTAAAFITGLSFLVAPATSSIPIGQTPVQLLTTVAAIQAQEVSASSVQPLACAALFSTSTAEVGQQVVLAWGSVGAVLQTKDTENMWPLNGGSLMSFATTGTWSYPFTFYSANGGSTTCTAKITVL
jgi:hypothetical protein